MAGSLKEPSAAPKIAHSSTREIIVTGAWALVLIVSFISVGFGLQHLFRQEFLGEKTKLIQECKKNPKFNPQACAELLEARTTTPPKKSVALPGSIPSAKFRLSSDKDADLKPPPDMVK